MPVEHKFLNNNNWNNGFWTENAILKTDLYKPEILILGTFNPNTPNANFADFFYGRNYFWTAFKNLFIENGFQLLSRRMPPYGQPALPLNPNLEEIFEICKKAKLSFADLICEVFVNHDNVEFLPNDNVVLNGNVYNLIQDNARNNILGLAELNQINEVEWNLNNILNYLIENPDIKYVYFTRRPTNIWLEKWEELKDSINLQDRNFQIIYTPSAQSLRGVPRMQSLINHWLFNNNPNYDRFSHDWLTRNDVNLNNFL